MTLGVGIMGAANGYYLKRLCVIKSKCYKFQNQDTYLAATCIRMLRSSITNTNAGSIAQY
jgi:hypothetical protein